MADGSIKYIDFDGDRYEIDPCNHASESTKFGICSDGIYGHCKVVDDFTNAAYLTNGEALSAHAGYVLNKMNYLEKGFLDFNNAGTSILHISYPILEKKDSTIVAGGIYRKKNSDLWEDMKSNGFKFIYEDNYIEINPTTSSPESYYYKIVLITR